MCPCPSLSNRLHSPPALTICLYWKQWKSGIERQWTQQLEWEINWLSFLLLLLLFFVWSTISSRWTLRLYTLVASNTSRLSWEFNNEWLAFMTNVLPIVVDFSWLDSIQGLASIHMIIIPSGEFVKLSLRETNEDCWISTFSAIIWQER